MGAAQAVTLHTHAVTQAHPHLCTHARPSTKVSTQSDQRHTHARARAGTWAWMSTWGFQSLSTNTTVSAAVRVKPRPPARVDSRKANVSRRWKRLTLVNRSSPRTEPSSRSYSYPLRMDGLGEHPDDTCTALTCACEDMTQIPCLAVGVTTGYQAAAHQRHASFSFGPTIAPTHLRRHSGYAFSRRRHTEKILRK